MSRRGGTGGGEWVHPKDANSMAFGFRKDVVGTVYFFPPMDEGALKTERFSQRGQAVLG